MYTCIIYADYENVNTCTCMYVQYVYNVYMYMYACMCSMCTMYTCLATNYYSMTFFRLSNFWLLRSFCRFCICNNASINCSLLTADDIRALLCLFKLSDDDLSYNEIMSLLIVCYNILIITSEFFLSNSSLRIFSSPSCILTSLSCSTVNSDTNSYKVVIKYINDQRTIIHTQSPQFIYHAI